MLVGTISLLYTMRHIYNACALYNFPRYNYIGLALKLSYYSLMTEGTNAPLHYFRGHLMLCTKSLL